MSPEQASITIACQVLQDVPTGLLPEDLINDVIVEDYDLHRIPHRFTQPLQELDDIEEPTPVVLGYKHSWLSHDTRPLDRVILPLV